MDVSDLETLLQLKDRRDNECETVAIPMLLLRHTYVVVTAACL